LYVLKPGDFEMTTFNEALAYAKQEIADGYLIAYYTARDPERGLCIYVESDQGWNPEPYWQEYGI